MSISSSTSSQSQDAAVLYIVVSYLSVLAVVGSAGNALVMYVFCKKKDKLTSTLFIIALATVDFITCLMVIPFTVYMEVVNFTVSSDICCKLYQFLITCNIPFSALVMVAIAVDRYLCICRPFTRLLTIDRAKILIGFLAAVAATLGACVAMFFGVYAPRNEATTNESENTTTTTTESDALLTPVGGYSLTSAATVDTDNDDGLINTGKCQENDLILSHDFQWYYQKLYTFMYPVCLLAVVVLYVLIYRSVLRRRYKRQKEKRKTLALVKSAQQAADQQMETPSPDRRKNVLDLAVDLKATDDVATVIEDQTVTTDINGCMSLIPVRFQQLLVSVHRININYARFLQRVSRASYAERCTSDSKSVCPSV